MEEWQDFFADRILTRGKSYFKQSRVKDLLYNKQQRTWTAAVQGRRLYHVQINLDDRGEFVNLSCSCPFAKQGNPCKHLAAVLYTLTAGKVLTKKHYAAEPAPTHKFLTKLKRRVDQQVTNDYYFDLRKILAGVDIDDEIFQKGLDVAKKGDFILEQLALTYDRDPQNRQYPPVYEQIIDSKGFDKTGKPAYLSVKRDRVIKVGCQICYREDRFCEHTTVLLLKLTDEIIENNPGDFTNYSGVSLLNSWEEAKTKQNQAELTTANQHQSISLRPEIIILDDKLLALRLKIAETGKRFYQVRNLMQLLQDFDRQATMRLGRKQRLSLRVASLTPDSLPLYDFLQRNVAPLVDLQKGFQQTYLENSFSSAAFGLHGYGSSALLLGPATLDDFFQTFNGQKVFFIDDYSKDISDLELSDGQVNLNINLKKYYDDTKNFQGLKVESKLPKLYFGKKAVYFVTDGFFYRTNLSQKSQVRTILSHGNFGDKIDALIGKQNLAEFYYQQLPEWQNDPNITVNQPKLAAGELPIEETFTFLLDETKQYLTCQVIVNRNGQEKNLLDQLHLLQIHQNGREKRIETDLMKFFNQVDQAEMNYQAEFSDERLFQLLTQIIPKLQTYGTVKVSTALKKVSVVSAPKVSVGVKLQGNLLNLQFNSQDFSAAELQQLFQQYRLKKKFYRLPNGSLVNLAQGNFAEINRLQQNLQLPAKELFVSDQQLGANRAFFLDQFLKDNQVNLNLKTNQQFEQLVKQFAKVERQKFTLPIELQATLRPYQKVGYQWLRLLTASHFSGILADEMGLGKTLQIIALLLANRTEGVIKQPSSLIVTPVSLIYNWQAELTKFAPQLKVALIAGTKKQRQQQLQSLAATKPDIVITSYDLLKRDLEEYQDIDFTFEIIDEAQYIKNPRTAAAKAVKQLKSQIRFALTGTPIENGLSELWSIFDFLMPGFLGTYHDFRSNYENPIIKDQQKSVQQKLNQLVSPFILRRLKRQVLKDLPEKTEQVYLVEMEKKQRALYQAQTSLLKKQVEQQSEQEFNQSKLEILAGLTKLREICCDPALVFTNYQQISAKRQACLDLVEQAVSDGHKILIFSQFVSLLKMLAKDLQTAGFKYYEIFGSTAKKQRTILAGKFNQDQVPVFLISLKAGGTGLNLTGADVVIHFDPWWNSAAQSQATDRAHRIGQQNKVNVYSLISKDSIEEKVLQLQQAKQQLADNLLNNEKITSGKLTKEDLLQILE
ncbi:SNF2-related protein [Liquorilactobacillus ghanensis]|uniref:SNF2-related protein n=1 Tax=Liquorilactobacillus ghanensis TaxID=399370 RepID=UPI0039E8D340